MVRRWQQLPLDRALAHVPAVLTALQEIVDATAASPAQAADDGRAPRLPDLGPAVVPEQVRVVVHDAASSPDADLTALADHLTALRRDLP